MPGESLESLVERFQNLTLPLAEWTHEAHLSVGLWMTARHGQAEAARRMRDGIRLYNVATGVGNSENHGYHETITLAWIEVLRQYLEQAPEHALADILAAFLAGEWSQRETLLRFYRRETLFSPLARRHWLEPDLEPIVVITSRSAGDL